MHERLEPRARPGIADARCDLVDAAKVDTRQAPRGVGRQPATGQVVDVQIEVGAQLSFESRSIAFCRNHVRNQRMTLSSARVRAHAHTLLVDSDCSFPTNDALFSHVRV